jgi:hypothetical protein
MVILFIFHIWARKGLNLSGDMEWIMSISDKLDPYRHMNELQKGMFGIINMLYRGQISTDMLLLNSYLDGIERYSIDYFDFDSTFDKAACESKMNELLKYLKREVKYFIDSQDEFFPVEKIDAAKSRRLNESISKMNDLFHIIEKVGSSML